jgi:hypothetical protein
MDLNGRGSAVDSQLHLKKSQHKHCTHNNDLNIMERRCITRKKQMRKRMGSSEVLALLAVAGIATTTVVNAADKTDTNSSTSKASSLKVVSPQNKVNLDDTKKKAKTETKKAAKTADSKKSGKEAACGKGSCGTDESGAKAAQDKHAVGKDAKKDAKKDAAPAASNKKGK